MAYKVFSNGSTLPASDLNTYLMNQSVMVFSSSAARASAITSPTEGMMTYLEDTNRFQYYNGTAWQDLSDEATGWSDKSANYSIVAADLGTTIRSTGSAITITIDNVLTQQGDRIDFIQAGAGQITFAAGSGVTLSSADSRLKTAKQFAAASVVFGGSGVYYLIGNLGA
jgi:formylmethanofuran dehydrogenase subunit A